MTKSIMSKNKNADDIIQKKSRNDKGRHVIQQKISNEIDVLFSKKKKKRVEETVEKVPEMKQDSWLDSAIKGSTINEISRANGQRITEEGYPIYQEEGLVSKTGGDTHQCPFDCICCY